jgi:hypothetical protein
MRDDGLEDPYGCTDPITGDPVSRGTVISVPIGLPMPPGSVPRPAYPVGGNAPTTSLYVCQDGRWVGIVSYRESPIELHSDVVSVVAVEGSPVVVTGRCVHARDTEITLTASVGSVEVDDDGGWTWQHAPDSGPTDSELVVITAMTDDNTTKVAFELTYPERRRG